MGLSPMMQQYFETKEQYKDCIVMYRLGDFYEMFFEDAVTVSRELDLTLTGRDCGLDERAPMCGVPFHAVDTYIARLIERGHKVAICEQMAPPERGTLVKRDVIRVVTAGTLTELEMLDEKSNNFIASVFFADGKIGLAWCDISTGEFNVNEYAKDVLTRLSDTLARIAPVEIICNEPMLEPSTELACVRAMTVPNFSMYRADAWEFDSANNTINGLLNDSALGKRYAICAAGALYSYVGEMQKRSIHNVDNIRLEDESAIMYLDATTRKNLELTVPMHENRGKKGTLLWLLDKTCTAMGRRRLRSWIESPLCNLDTINSRLDCVEEFFGNKVLMERVRNALRAVLDLERLCSKVAYRSVTPRDMAAIRASLGAIPTVRGAISSCKSSGICKLHDDIDTMTELYERLSAALVDEPPAFTRDGGFVKDGYNSELDEIRGLSTDATTWLAALEATEKEQTGIRNLKIGFNRVFGYYIEVSKSQTSQVPFRYQRKQTTVNGERYITPELKDLEDRILSGRERSLELELKIYEELVEELSNHVLKIQSTARALSVLDCLAAFAQVACDYQYVRPTIADDGKIEIDSGRHPTIERMSNDLFVPNNTSLNDTDERIMIITGPNMAGKSTYMRQVALIVIMSHIGCFVPAKSAHITLTDRVFTRIGASDDLLTGQSTFMVEMLEVANILDHATSKSLLLLDEIGRGTSTYDGLSIAWAVMEYLSQNLCTKSLFSTHYHELTELEKRLSGVKNYRVTVKELGGTIAFLHKIARGCALRSYGIEVAQLAGVNKTVVDRAKVILENLKHNDINQSVADDVMGQQTSFFDAVSLKGYYEIKDILASTNFNQLTPMKAFELLADIAERIKE